VHRPTLATNTYRRKNMYQSTAVLIQGSPYMISLYNRHSPASNSIRLIPFQSHWDSALAHCHCMSAE